LDLGNHQLAKFIHTRRLSANDDVVRTRDIFGQRDALNGADGTRDVGRLADIGLDQDVRLYDHRDSFVAVTEAIRFRQPLAAYARRCASRYIVRCVDEPPGACEMPVAPQTSTQTLSELGEFALIETLTDGVSHAPGVLIGPGDDAAAIEITGILLSSVDVLVEGVHFRRDWVEAHDVGRRAVAVNVADIEAMGGRAVGMLAGFSAPGDLPVAWAREFADGLQTECAAAGVALLGGDVTRARDVTVAVTVLGVTDGVEPVRRGGARPGDVVALTGRVGWAGAGLLVLSRGFRSPRAVVDAYRVPQVPYGAGAAAARAGAHAMIDISDGLLADLGHVAAASGVEIDLHRHAFDVPEALHAVAAATNTDPYSLILTGGEDHALAATFSAAAELPEGWFPIGSVGAVGADGPRVLVDGASWDSAGGFDHFRSVAQRR
jgi:thiamine-monophosphate kinase